jgi:hypothetical protein
LRVAGHHVTEDAHTVSETRALEPRLRRHLFGWSGLIIGLLALALGLLPGWIAPLYDPPTRPIPQRAADWLSEIKDKAMAAIRAETPPPPPPEQRNFWRNPHLAVWSLLLGFTALLLGIVSFVRHEDQRLVACSIALAAGTICAQYFLTAVMILTFAILVGVVLSRQG